MTKDCPEQCPPRAHDQFGLSPTLQIIRCSCDGDACSCQAECGCLDLVINADDTLSVDCQVTHHVLLRLATRRTIEDDEELPLICSDRGGWWAEMFGFSSLGSRLWVMPVVRPEATHIRSGEDMVREALADLEDAQMLENVQVSGAFDPCEGTLHLTGVTFDRPQTRSRETYDWMWETQA